MDGLRFGQSRKSFHKDMSTTEDIDDNSIDKRVHSYDMGMDSFFELFEMSVMKIDQFESFLEIFSIYTMMVVSGFWLFFEEIEHMFAIFPEKDQKYHNYDGDNED